MDAEATFNSLVGDLDYPMLIVTACAAGEPTGCLVGFATQTSIDPSRFLVCGPEGVPLLDACPNRFVGRVVRRIDAGHPA